MVKQTQTIRRQIAGELFECLTILYISVNYSQVTPSTHYFQDYFQNIFRGAFFTKSLKSCF